MVTMTFSLYCADRLCIDGLFERNARQAVIRHCLYGIGLSILPPTFPELPHAVNAVCSGGCLPVSFRPFRLARLFLSPTSLNIAT